MTFLSLSEWSRANRYPVSRRKAKRFLDVLIGKAGFWKAKVKANHNGSPWPSPAGRGNHARYLDLYSMFIGKHSVCIFQKLADDSPSPSGRGPG
jgi:hypothetical protein